MKSEPDVFSFDDLLARPNKSSIWDNIRNYQARNFIRDDIKVGDKVLFYHSSTKIPSVAGIAKVISKPYPDPSQFDPKSDYYDPKSNAENPRWLALDVQALEKFERYVTLAEIRLEPTLSQMRLVQKGNRLSIMPVSKKEFAKIVTLGKD